MFLDPYDLELLFGGFHAGVVVVPLPLLLLLSFRFPVIHLELPLDCFDEVISLRLKVAPAVDRRPEQFLDWAGEQSTMPLVRKVRGFDFDLSDTHDARWSQGGYWVLRPPKKPPRRKWQRVALPGHGPLGRLLASSYHTANSYGILQPVFAPLYPDFAIAGQRGTTANIDRPP